MVRICLSLILFSCSSAIASEPIKKVVTVIALGDSLTDGYGIERENAYPALLQKKFEQLGWNTNIINGGISGSTSAGAESRLRWYLRSKPDIVMLGLGANDGLRGVPVKTTKANLKKTIDLAKLNGVQILLLGMKLPRNYGQEYRMAFEKMYATLAAEEKTPFLPFFLDGVATKPELNLPDAIHPNEKGHAVIAETLFSFLKPHVDKLRSK